MKKRITSEREIIITSKFNQNDENSDKFIYNEKDSILSKDYIKFEDKIVSEISELASENNFEIYIVGGYVRDYFLARSRTDYDFTVVGDSVAFSKIVAKRFKSKPIIFEKFYTSMIPLKNGIQLEFVGTRKEKYDSDSRKPIVTIGSLEDDLKRRDFTVNAMAVSLNKDHFGKIIDLFNGRKDLLSNVLRTPLEPLKTFDDDPLRMLRAIRFASQLNFTIDSKTFEAIKIMNHRITIVSQERITAEFMKILQSKKPSIGLSLLSESGLLAKIFPELEELKGTEIKIEGNKQFAHKDVYKHSLIVVDNVSNQSENVWLRFAALVHDIAKPRTKKYNPVTGWSFHGHEEIGAKMVEKIFRKFKFPLEFVEYVSTLVRLHQRPMMLVDQEITDSAIRRLAFNAGEYLEDLFTLCKADITTKNPNLSSQYFNNYEIVKQKVLEVQEKDKLREFQSPVRGEEIMEICNLAPCKAIGIIKSNIENAILDGIIDNDYNLAKEYFLKNMNLWLADIDSKDKIKIN